MSKSDLSSLCYQLYLKDEGVLAKACSIRDHVVLHKETNGDQRTPEQIFEDSCNGMALERAVIVWLMLVAKLYSLTVEVSTCFEYDVLVTTSDGRKFKIDIKGLFDKASGTWVRRSKWEHKNAHNGTWYLVFDCRDHGANARYLGWCRGGEFRFRQGNNDPYFKVEDLRPNLPFLEN